MLTKLTTLLLKIVFNNGEPKNPAENMFLNPAKSKKWRID